MTVLNGVLGAIAAVLTAGGVRWMVGAIRRDIERIVTDAVVQRLDDIETSLTTLRLENAQDHALTAGRLEALEKRVRRLEDLLNRQAPGGAS